MSVCKVRICGHSLPQFVTLEPRETSLYVSLHWEVKDHHSQLSSILQSLSNNFNGSVSQILNVLVGMILHGSTWDISKRIKVFIVNVQFTIVELGKKMIDVVGINHVLGIKWEMKSASHKVGYLFRVRRIKVNNSSKRSGDSPASKVSWKRSSSGIGSSPVSRVSPIGWELLVLCSPLVQRWFQPSGQGKEDQRENQQRKDQDQCHCSQMDSRCHWEWDPRWAMYPGPPHWA